MSPVCLKIQNGSEQIDHILLLGSGTPTQYHPTCGASGGRVVLPGCWADPHAVHSYHGAIYCRSGTIWGWILLCCHRTDLHRWRILKPVHCIGSKRSDIWPVLYRFDYCLFYGHILPAQGKRFYILKLIWNFYLDFS